VRKKGKLPYRTISESYALEYGVDEVEIHVDAIKEGDKVLLVDDLIATGGTAGAAIRLIERAGGTVVLCSFVVDLPDLGGSAKLRAMGKEVVTLVAFEGD
jgi:adenine phosphoribosyltransferase